MLLISTRALSRPGQGNQDIGDDLSRSLRLFSLKITFHAVDHGLSKQGQGNQGIWKGTLWDALFLSFNLVFNAHPKKDHGLIRPGQGNQDIGEGAH